MPIDPVNCALRLPRVAPERAIRILRGPGGDNYHRRQWRRIDLGRLGRANLMSEKGEHDSPEWR